MPCDCWPGGGGAPGWGGEFGGGIARFRSRSDGSEDELWMRAWPESCWNGRAAEEWKGVSEGRRWSGLWAAYAGLWLGLRHWVWDWDACVGRDGVERAEGEGEG